MASNRSNDVNRRNKVEEKFENNIPARDNDPLSEVVKQEDMIKTLEVLYQIPYAAGLTDCPRIVWMLNEIYEYPPLVIARLMGKKRNVVDTNLFDARYAVKKFGEAMKRTGLSPYDLSIADLRIPQETGVVLERTAKPVNPLFSEDELKPLEMTVEEFNTHYVASFMMPGPYYGGWDSDLYLLLTRRFEWPFVRLNDMRLFNIDSCPNELLVKVHVEENYIHLAPVHLLNFWYYLPPDKDPRFDKVHVEENHIVEKNVLAAKDFLLPKKEICDWIKEEYLSLKQYFDKPDGAQHIVSMHQRKTNKYFIANRMTYGLLPSGIEDWRRSGSYPSRPGYQNEVRKIFESVRTENKPTNPDNPIT
jgi:hypothetical protein